MTAHTCISHTPQIETGTFDFENFGDLGKIFRRYADDVLSAARDKTSVILYGPVGTGKTTLAGLFHKTLAYQGRLVHWVDCSIFPDNYDQADEVVGCLSSNNARICVFDDFGREPPNVRRAMQRIIFARAARLKSRLDIYTTNLTVNPHSPNDCALTTEYNEAVRSRIFGMCGEMVVEYNGPDHRTEV